MNRAHANPVDSMEKALEKKSAERELNRSQIEKNKKDREEEKNKAEEKKQLKLAVSKSNKVAVKKSSKVGKVEAAPKEAIAPTVEATASSFLAGTDAAYQSRPSRLPMREEARRAWQSRPEVEAERRPCSNVRLVKEEGGLDLFRKNEEARRVRRERMRAEREKKEKKEEEERKKEQEKKMEQERQLMKQIEDGLESLWNGITETKKLVVKKPSKQCQSVVKKMASVEKAIERVPSIAARAVPVAAQSALTGTEAPYQSHAEMKYVGLEKSRALLKAEISDLLRRRAEVCELLRVENEKKRKERAEYRKKEAEEFKEREEEREKERSETLESLSEEWRNIARKLGVKKRVKPRPLWNRIWKRGGALDGLSILVMLVALVVLHSDFESD